MPFHSIPDLERAAEAVLDPVIFDYYAGAAMDEVTLRENTSAFDRFHLQYSVFRGGGARRMSTTVLGKKIAMPIMLSPVAFQRMAHPDGELATARAAAQAGTLMIVSMLSTTPIEEITDAHPGPVWMQTYIERNRKSTRNLIKRAEAAGCKALVLTADSLVSGRLDRILRNDFAVPSEFMATNLMPKGLTRMPKDFAMKIDRDMFEARLDPDLTWKDVEWLAGQTNLPLVIKGLVRPDDAVRAVQAGAQGIIVSNHGGRQLDTAVPTIDVIVLDVSTYLVDLEV